MYGVLTSLAISVEHGARESVSDSPASITIFLGAARGAVAGNPAPSSTGVGAEAARTMEIGCGEVKTLFLSYDGVAIVTINAVAINVVALDVAMLKVVKLNLVAYIK